MNRLPKGSKSSDKSTNHAVLHCLICLLLKNSSNLFPCPEGSYLPIDMILVPFVYVKILSNKHVPKINPFDLTKKTNFPRFKILAENINMIGKILENDRSQIDI